jgi:hypothetical protein
MAKLIFVGFVLVGTFYVWNRRDSAHGRAIKRILLVGFAGLVVFTILFPETTTIAAKWVGIGRGTDLVFYLTSFAVMFLAALVYLKFKRLEDRIASLTSELALRDWERELAIDPVATHPPAGPGSQT